MAKRALFDVQVLGREALTPGMLRLFLGGDSLHAFESERVGDEFVRLFFPDARTGRLVQPIMHEDGGYAFAPDDPRPHSEVYTVRAFDAARSVLTIDFVIHDGGYASEWAQAAQPGDRLLLTSPRALYKAPADARRQVFVCDATGLPAVCRMLEALPADVEALVIAEVAAASHRQALASPARVEAFWLEGSGNGVGPSMMAQALESLARERRPDYVWMAGEQKEARAVRKFVRQTLGLPADRYAILGYWTDQRAQWEAGWQALDPALKARIADAWASGRDREDVRDEVEAVLEKAGL